MKKLFLAAFFIHISFLIVAQKKDATALTYTLVPEFPSLPVGTNFMEVTGVALNSKGHVFVFNRGDQPIMEFDESGKFIRSLAAGLFKAAHGLRIDANDNIWVTDLETHLVLKLNPDGRILMVLGEKGKAGEWNDVKKLALFNKPADVAFAKNGDFFVADGYGNSRIVKFDKDGNFIKTWGKKGTAEGEFDNPHNVIIDAKGLLYVADQYNKRIQVFDQDGKFVKALTNVGTPSGLDLTKDQMLYVSDGTAEQVKIMDLNGNIQTTFGEPGKKPGQFTVAHGIAVSKNLDVYVTEVLNWRVQKFVKKTGK